jgi:HAD superfamily hydrolase (TIGR01484 family)
VDVLPAAAGKGKAMEFVRRRLGFARSETVAAGDGANDLEMLQQVGVGYR